MSDDLETVAVPTPFGMVLVGMASNRRLAALARNAHGEGAQRLLGVGTATPVDPIVIGQLRALAGRACLYVPAARDGDRALLLAIERAIASGLLAAVFIPRAPLGPMVEGPRVAPQVAAAKPFKAMSATDRIAELLRETPAYLGSDLAAAFRRMVTAEALAGIAAAFAVLLAAQFVGVGEIADAALAYWAYAQAGLSGLYGLYEALRAVVDAVRAPDEAAFKDAVRRFADGLSLVGIALLTAVVTRAARRRAAGSETESGGGGGDGGGTGDRAASSRSSGRSGAPAAAADAAATRRGIAADFYQRTGWPANKIDGHLDCIDYSKDVSVVTLHAGDTVTQWVNPARGVGSYFAPAAEGATPGELGISGENRVLQTFTVTRDTEVLQSTAARTVDTWSGPTPVVAPGGATQWFAADNAAFQPVGGGP